MTNFWNVLWLTKFQIVFFCGQSFKMFFFYLQSFKTFFYRQSFKRLFNWQIVLPLTKSWKPKGLSLKRLMSSTQPTQKRKKTINNFRTVIMRSRIILSVR
jgi:hypothetical protein